MVQNVAGARLLVLDGLRGWGAVFVVLFHVFCDALPVSSESSIMLRRLLPFSGLYAVMIFFMVSGIALSTRYLVDGNNRELFKSATGRYFRLATPILILCLGVHFAIARGLLAEPNERLPIFAGALNFDSTVANVLQFSLFDVFFRYSYSQTYAGPLWTMSVEFIGSFVLFAVLLISVRIRQPFWALVISSLALVILATTDSSRLYSLFLFGAALAAAIHRGWLEMVSEKVAAGLLVAGLGAPLLLPLAYDIWNVLATVVLTTGCICFSPARTLLESRLSRALGRISFALYLVHGPILVFVGDPLTQRFGTSRTALVAVDLAVIAISFLAALPMMKVTDYSILISRAAGRYADGFVAVLLSAYSKGVAR